MNHTRQLINSSGNHTVQICLTENSQVDLATRYIKDGLLTGDAVFIISRPGLRKNLKLKMDGLSFDGQALQDSNQIRFFDAEFLLLYLKADDDLGEVAFHENVTAPLYNVQAGYKKVRAFGEMFDILWRQGQHDLVIQLISFFKNLTDPEGCSHLDTYSLDHLDSDLYDGALELICEYHSHLAPQQHDDSTEQQPGETANPFGAAWNRIINKRAHQTEHFVKNSLY